MFLVHAFLAPTWETWIELPAPGLGLAQCQSSLSLSKESFESLQNIKLKMSGMSPGVQQDKQDEKLWMTGTTVHVLNPSYYSIFL